MVSVGSVLCGDEELVFVEVKRPSGGGIRGINTKTDI